MHFFVKVFIVDIIIAVIWTCFIGQGAAWGQYLAIFVSSVAIAVPYWIACKIGGFIDRWLKKRKEKA
jgi:cbb3-type cytochrome oxidase subunit 1